jgi:hypothetical protein
MEMTFFGSSTDRRSASSDAKSRASKTVWPRKISQIYFISLQEEKRGHGANRLAKAGIV